MLHQFSASIVHPRFICRVAALSLSILIGHSQDRAEDPLVPGEENCRTRSVPHGNLLRCGRPEDMVGPPNLDVDMDGTNESWGSDTSVMGSGGVSVRLVCVAGKFFSLKITKPTGMEFAGGCQFSHANNEYDFLYKDTDGDGVFTDGVDMIKQVRSFNEEAVGPTWSTGVRMNFFTYYVASGTRVRVRFIRDAADPNSPWRVDDNQWPPKSGPSSGTPVDPNDLFDDLFGSALPQIPPTEGCMAFEGVPIFLLTPPTTSASSIAPGESITYQGDVVALNGFSQSLTLRATIGRTDGPFSQSFELGTIAPPYPAPYQRTILIPPNFPPGNHQTLFWAQTSDGTEVGASDLGPLSVSGMDAMPTLSVGGLVVLVVLLGLVAALLLSRRSRRCGPAT